MHVDFDPLKIEWPTFAQAADGSPQLQPIYFQYGGSIGYNVFRGMPYQRGSGLGSVLRSFLRHLMPIGREIGHAVGRQALESGNRVLGNVLDGQNLKQSLIEEGRSGIKNLLEKAANNLERQKGQGFDFKRYNKKLESTKTKQHTANKRSKKYINSLGSTIGPPDFLPTSKKQKKKQSKTKRLRIDALGTF